MKLLAIVGIILFLGIAAKVVWDAAEVHELHKMRAAFDYRIIEVRETFKDLVPGLTEAENFIEDELDHEPTYLDNIENRLGL